MWSRFVAVAAGAALIGLVPGAVRAQAVGGVYTGSPLSTIERNQRSQLEANRNNITSQGVNRYQSQLDLEKQVYDEARRRREDYLFQGNTQQRALETQLREEDSRLRQQDSDNREREVRQRQEVEQGIAETRRRQGLQ
jgi:hypothetical protein